MGLLYKDESYAIMGACYEVYREKGSGFVEPIYHECLEHEFELRKLPAVSKPRLEIEYKGRKLSKSPEPDFICFGKIILEIKSVKFLTDQHRAQLQNYLRATGFQLGLLVNFGHYPKVESERVVLSHPSVGSTDKPPHLQ